MDIKAKENVAKKLLDQISEYQAQKMLIDIDKQKMIDEVLTPEIKEKLAEIDAEFADHFVVVDQKIKDLTDKVNKLVLTLKVTVHGAYKMAIYNKGRDGGWNTKALEGYATAHPEIKKFKNKDGDPYISYREIKKRKK